MKWGDKYGPEYVNRLYAAAKKNVTGEFSFACLTDDSSGLDPANLPLVNEIVNLSIKVLFFHRESLFPALKS